MICPRCAIEMRKVMVNNVELDTCNNCEGVWFDKDELRQILDMGQSAVVSSGISNTMDSEIELEESAGLSDMPCPRCRQGLIRYHYQGYSGILLDGCDNQCGIWLDDGELRKLFNFMLDAAKPDPLKEAGLVADLKKIKMDSDARQKKVLDSLVSMNNRAGVMRIPGAILQGIYTIFHKIGI